MTSPLHIVGIIGSLRKASFNRSLMAVVPEVLPEGVTFEIAEIGDLSLFNQDNEQTLPQAVQRMKEQIKKADAIIIATPEYNYSIPGVLKNAIDWASRPYGNNSFEGKAIGIMGASMGNIATARAQYHLRQCFVFLNGHLLNRPEVMVGSAQDKFDANGKLTDEHTREKVKELVSALIAWAQKLK